MEYRKLLLLEFFISLIRVALVYGQETFPTCSYLNRTKLEEFKRLNPNVEIRQADSSTTEASVNFKLTSRMENNSLSVTLDPINLGSIELKTIVIEAFDYEDSTWIPKGNWIKMNGQLECTTSMTVTAIYELVSVNKKDAYMYTWKPSDESIETVVFRATVRSTNMDGLDVLFFGIESEPINLFEGTSTTGAPTKHGGPPLRLDIIIICASAFLVVILIIAICCFVMKRKEGTDEEKNLQDDTDLNDYKFREGTPNNGHENPGTEQVGKQGGRTNWDKLERIPKSNNGQENPGTETVGEQKGRTNWDKLEEIPEIKQKYVKPRRVSDLIEKELEEKGETLGRRAGTIEIMRSHVILKEAIGEGAFGDVYKAQAYGITNNPITNVAVKILKDPTVADTAFKQELKILMTFEPHPNIIQLMGACTEKEPYFLVLEYAELGDLRAYLHKQRSASGKKQLDSKKLIGFAVQIAKGMEYIASKECVHRDLATRNVLLGEGLVCKLSDFGLARNVDLKQQYEMSTDTRVPVRWMAPESIKDNLYSTKSDVWSFGVLCWELVTMGSHPYGGFNSKQVIKMVTHGERLEKPSHCSKEMYDVIMTACWQEKPSKRPGFPNLRQQLGVMLANAEENIVPARFDSKGYVYLRPENWQNSEGDKDKKRPIKKNRRTIPNNYELEFRGASQNK